MNHTLSLQQDSSCSVVDGGNQKKCEVFVIISADKQNQTTEVDSETQRIYEVLLEELPLHTASALAAKLPGKKTRNLCNFSLEDLQKHK